MKRKQVIAIVLAAIMSVSACMPINGISAFAAENTNGTTKGEQAEVMSENDINDESEEADEAVSDSEEMNEETEAIGEEIKNEETKSDDDSKEESVSEEDTEGAVEDLVKSDEETDGAVEDGIESDKETDEVLENGVESDEETDESVEKEEKSDEEGHKDESIEAEGAEEDAKVEEPDEQKDAPKKSGMRTNALTANNDGTNDGITVYCNGPSDYSKQTGAFTVEYVSSSYFEGYPYEPVTFEVKGSNEDLTYQWYKNQEIVEGATFQSYSDYIGIDYMCKVTDGTDTVFMVFTTLPVYKYNISAYEYQKTAIKGDSVYLGVSVDSYDAGLTYHWKEMMYNEDGNLTVLYEETTEGASYKTRPVTQDLVVSCYAEDEDGKYSNEEYMYVNVSNRITAVYAKGYDEDTREVDIKAKEGKNVTLEVVVEGDDAEEANYSWEYWKTTFNDEMDFPPLIDSYPEINDSSFTFTAGEVQDEGVIEDYRCTVTGPDGSSSVVIFHITVTDEADDEFTVDYVSSSYFDVDMGTECLLEVSSSYDAATFEWFRNDIKIEGAESSSYTTTKGGKYICRVSNGTDTKELSFTVFYTGNIEITPGGSDPVMVAPGERTTLSVVPYPIDRNFIYHWTVQSVSGENEEYYNSFNYDGTYSAYTTPPVNEPLFVECSAEDEDGVWSDALTVGFNVIPDNGLKAYPKGEWPEVNSTTISAQIGEKVTLEVVTEAVDIDGMTYAWYPYNDELGDYDNNKIDGETKAYYSFDVSEDAPLSYLCTVTDKYKVSKEVYFNIVIDGSGEDEDFGIVYRGVDFDEGYAEFAGITVAYDVEDNHFAIAPGTECTFKVKSDSDDVTYEWYRYGIRIEEASSPTYTVSEHGDYECHVVYRKDEDNVMTWVLSFFVENNVDFSISAKWDDAVFNAGLRAYGYVADGATTTLEVETTPSDADLTYYWECFEANDFVDGPPSWSEWNETYLNEWSISGDTNNITVPSITKPTRVSCRAEDKNGNGGSGDVVNFYLYPKSDMVVYPKNEGPGTDYSVVQVREGEAVTLEVAVEASNPEGISYRWYKYDDSSHDEDIEGVTGNSYSFTYTPKLDNGGNELDVTYCCEVTDQYGVSVIIQFLVTSKEPADFTEANVILDQTEFTYDGERQAPIVDVVYFGEETLIENMDYEVSYSDESSTDAGEYKMYISGKGMYEGEIEKDYVINKAQQQISADDLSMEPGDKTKIAVTGVLTSLTYASADPSVATVSADGTVTAVGAGNTTITIKAEGNNNCDGDETEISVTVTAVDISDENKTKVTLDRTEFTYDGKTKSPKVTEVAYNGTALAEGVDYEVSYSDKNSTNAGEYTVSITGKGKYIGKIEKGYVIGKADQVLSASSLKLTMGDTSKINVSGGQGIITYSSADWPIATVGSDGTVTTKGVGVTTITITAASTSNYNAATTHITVEVIAKLIDLSDAAKVKVTLDKTAFTWNRRDQISNVTAVTYSGIKLIEGVDYEVSHNPSGDYTSPGKKTISIVGKGKYCGAAEAAYVINKADQKLVCPEINVKIGGTVQLSLSGLNDKNAKDAVYGTVTAKSGNEKVAKVSTTGTASFKVTAIAPGTVTLTFRAAGDTNHNPATITKTVKIAGGWVSNSAGWRYWHADGTYSKSKFEVIGGKKYYFNGNGYRVTGFQTIAGKKYYFGTDGVMKTGWQTIKGSKYYFSTAGVMKTGWMQQNGKYYFFNDNGVMKTGWMQKTGKYYYFNDNGVMKTGWMQKNGKYYFFNDKGVMKTGWMLKNGKYYYFKENGQMVTGRYKIGSRWFTFDKNGVKK